MKTKTCTYHCRTCDRHFHSLGAFDLHRVFSDPQVEDWDTRVCLDPRGDAERLTTRSGRVRLRVYGRGVCRIQRGADDPVEDVEIWQENSDSGFAAKKEEAA